MQGPFETDHEKEYNDITYKVCVEAIKSQSLNPYARRLYQVLLNKNHPLLLSFLRINPEENLKKEDEIKKSIESFSYAECFSCIVKFHILSVYTQIISFIAIFINNRSITRFSIFETNLDLLASTESFNSKIKNDRILNNHLLPEGVHLFSLSQKQKKTKNITYLKRLPFLIPLFVSWDLLKFTSVVKHSFITSFVFLKLILSDKKNALLFKDFASWPLMRVFNNYNMLFCYAKTGSEYNDQQFWLEDKDKTYNFLYWWYSTNTVPIMKISQQDYYLVNYKLSYYEQSITWSLFHKKWLDKISKNEVLLSTPLVFKKEQQKDTPLEDKYIAIFDMKPFEPGYLNSLFLLPEEMYYSKERCTQYLLDIVEYFDNSSCNIQLVIKNKRKPHPYHVPSYQKIIDDLESTRKVTVVEDVDIVAFIENAVTCISIPYTSTNNIASYLGKNSIYYNPFQELRKNCNNDIFLCNGKEQLHSKLNDILEISNEPRRT